MRYVDPDGHDADEAEPAPDPPQGQDAKRIPVPRGPGPTPAEAQQTYEVLKKIWELPDPYLYPISQAIGTAPDPTIPAVPIGPIAVPVPKTDIPPSSGTQPLPPPPPVQAKKQEVKTATRTPGGVTPGQTVTDKQAADRLKKGGDTVSSSRSKARQVAKKAAGGGKVVHHKPHGPGYRPHYHDKKHKNGHSFYD